MFEFRVDHLYILRVYYGHTRTYKEHPLVALKPVSTGRNRLSRARTCVKHYAGKRRTLEMQIFAASAIKVLGARKSRPFFGLFIVEKTRRSPRESGAVSRASRESACIIERRFNGVSSKCFLSPFDGTSEVSVTLNSK